MKGGEKMEIGDTVIFTDPTGKDFNALLTAVWGEGESPSVNLVYVSNDAGEHDQYGRQIKRNTSVVHESNQAAHGMKWRKS